MRKRDDVFATLPARFIAIYRLLQNFLHYFTRRPPLVILRSENMLFVVVSIVVVVLSINKSLYVQVCVAASVSPPLASVFTRRSSGRRI